MTDVSIINAIMNQLIRRARANVLCSDCRYNAVLTPNAMLHGPLDSPVEEGHHNEGKL